MQIEKYKLYFSGDLMSYLKERNLPFSKPTLIRYEKLGVIKCPRTQVGKGNFTWRIYTGQEMMDIAESLKDYLIKKYT